MEVEASRTVELQSVVEPSVWLLGLCWRPLKEQLERDMVVAETSLTELLHVRSRRLAEAASALTSDGGSWLGLLGRCTSMDAVVMTRALGSGMPTSVMREVALTQTCQEQHAHMKHQTHTHTSQDTIQETKMNNNKSLN